MKKRLKFGLQFFAGTDVTTAAEPNLITQEQMKKAREVDFLHRFDHDSLAKLIEVLGVTRKIPMMEGTTLYYYKITGELQDGNVPEGEIIPLSKFETEKVPIGKITLKKWRKATSAEAIAKSGYDAAVVETDAKMLRMVQNGIRTNLFDFLNGEIPDSTPAVGKNLQSALSAAWGQLQVKFEDDTTQPVYFLNPLDVSDYLANANITTQTAFGMNYIENFLGLGTVIMSARIASGTFVATAKENFIMYYLTMGGDVARALNLTADELGLIGINSGYLTEERAQVETMAASGIQFLVEYAEGVVKGFIGDNVSVSPETATVEKGSTQKFTAGGGGAVGGVTWTVTGASSVASGTKMSEDGILTIAETETNTSLTVKATSTKDSTKTGTATVTVEMGE